MTECLKEYTYRLFGMPDCETCYEIKLLLEDYGLLVDYIDADEDDTQELCDFFDIEECPHVQVLENNLLGEKQDILCELVGSFNLVDLAKKVINST